MKWRVDYLGFVIQGAQPIRDRIIFTQPTPEDPFWLPVNTPPAYRTDPVVQEYIGHLQDEVNYWRARAERAESGVAGRRWPEWRP